MNLKKIYMPMVCICVIGLAICPMVNAQNLLTVNPGFETGDFTGWSDFSSVPAIAGGVLDPAKYISNTESNTGTYSACFTIDQTDPADLDRSVFRIQCGGDIIATVSGSEYYLGGWVSSTNLIDATAGGWGFGLGQAMIGPKAEHQGFGTYYPDHNNGPYQGFNECQSNWFPVLETPANGCNAILSNPYPAGPEGGWYYVEGSPPFYSAGEPLRFLFVVGGLVSSDNPNKPIGYFDDAYIGLTSQKEFQSGTNMMTVNPGFETGDFTGWTDFSSVPVIAGGILDPTKYISNTVSNTGTYSACFTVDQTDPTDLDRSLFRIQCGGDVIATVSASEYYVGGWVSCTNLANATAGAWGFGLGNAVIGPKAESPGFGTYYPDANNGPYAAYNECQSTWFPVVETYANGCNSIVSQPWPQGPEGGWYYVEGNPPFFSAGEPLRFLFLFGGQVGSGEPNKPIGYFDDAYIGMTSQVAVVTAPVPVYDWEMYR